jgi:hypothetical protein
VKYRLYDASCVEYWDLFSDTANTAATILGVIMYWSIILVVLGMESTGQSILILKMATVIITKGLLTPNIGRGSQPNAETIHSNPAMKT